LAAAQLRAVGLLDEMPDGGRTLVWVKPPKEILTRLRIGMRKLRGQYDAIEDALPRLDAGYSEKDSLPVLRLNLSGGTVDTVARLSVPEFGEATFGPQKQTVAQIFGPTDVFGVLPDGTVWVARARTMSVDWRAPDGTWTTGPAHPYTRVTVTDEDRKRVMDRLHARGLPTNVEVVFPFAKTKPSFEAGIGRPGGEVWLQLSRADEADPISYAVIGKDGKMQRTMLAPPGVGITSVSNQYAYGALKTEDRRELVRLAIP